MNKIKMLPTEWEKIFTDHKIRLMTRWLRWHHDSMDISLGKLWEISEGGRKPGVRQSTASQESGMTESD